MLRYPRFDLEPGNYLIEMNVRSSHANRLLNVVLWDGVIQTVVVDESLDDAGTDWGRREIRFSTTSARQTSFTIEGQK